MIAINRQERDVLRDELKMDMAGIDEPLNWLPTAEIPGPLWHETRRHYWTAMHLLDDLGWSYDDPRETFYVTLPPPCSDRWLQECSSDAEGVLLEHAQSFGGRRTRHVGISVPHG